MEESMRSRKNAVFLFVIGAMLLSLFAVQIRGTELLPNREIHIQSANLVLTLQNQWTLLDKVEECKQILKASPALEFVETKKVLVRKQISLCILNIETGNVVEKRYWLDNNDINRANTLRSSYQANTGNLPRFMPVDPKEEFQVINNWWNGWNSDWSIEVAGSTSNDIYIVLADKYSVPNSYITHPEDKTGPKYSDIIYAPYSEGVHDPEVAKRGLAYLNEKVDLAFQELRSQGVMSRSFPKELVVDTISPTFIKIILTVEQTDRSALIDKAVTDDERRKVAERVLARYGLNGDKSFRYTVSRAGAVGPAQIMASTGSLIIKRYPTADLFKDINLGRVDMVNAVKMAVLVFDDHLLEVINRVNKSGSRAKQVFNTLTPDQLDEVRGMIYNGGSRKYNISTGGLNTRDRGAQETSGFLQKLRVIRGLKIYN